MNVDARRTLLSGFDVSSRCLAIAPAHYRVSLQSDLFGICPIRVALTSYRPYGRRFGEDFRVFGRDQSDDQAGRRSGRATIRPGDDQAGASAWRSVLASRASTPRRNLRKAVTAASSALIPSMFSARWERVFCSRAASRVPSTYPSKIAG
jgi:hypothetical protein